MLQDHYILNLALSVAHQTLKTSTARWAGHSCVSFLCRFGGHWWLNLEIYALKSHGMGEGGVLWRDGMKLYLMATINSGGFWQ